MAMIGLLKKETYAMKALQLAVSTPIAFYMPESFAQESPQWRLPDGAKDWLTLDYKSDISKF